MLLTGNHANWMDDHQPLWRQEVYQDLWASGQTKTVTVYHVTGHLLLEFPGNNEADEVAQVHWIEGKSASNAVQWLHNACCMWGRRQHGL